MLFSRHGQIIFPPSRNKLTHILWLSRTVRIIKQIRPGPDRNGIRACEHKINCITYTKHFFTKNAQNYKIRIEAVSIRKYVSPLLREIKRLSEFRLWRNSLIVERKTTNLTNKCWLRRKFSFYFYTSEEKTCVILPSSHWYWVIKFVYTTDTGLHKIR